MKTINRSTIIFALLLFQVLSLKTAPISPSTPYPNRINGIVKINLGDCINYLGPIGNLAPLVELRNVHFVLQSADKANGSDVLKAYFDLSVPPAQLVFSDSLFFAISEGYSSTIAIIDQEGNRIKSWPLLEGIRHLTFLMSTLAIGFEQTKDSMYTSQPLSNDLTLAISSKGQFAISDYLGKYMTVFDQVRTHYEQRKLINTQSFDLEQMHLQHFNDTVPYLLFTKYFDDMKEYGKDKVSFHHVVFIGDRLFSMIEMPTADIRPYQGENTLFIGSRLFIGEYNISTDSLHISPIDLVDEQTKQWGTDQTLPFLMPSPDKCFISVWKLKKPRKAYFYAQYTLSSEGRWQFDQFLPAELPGSFKSMPDPYESVNLMLHDGSAYFNATPYAVQLETGQMQPLPSQKAQQDWNLLAISGKEHFMIALLEQANGYHLLLWDRDHPETHVRLSLPEMAPGSLLPHQSNFTFDSQGNLYWIQGNSLHSLHLFPSS
jgi:hypothetical protein